MRASSGLGLDDFYRRVPRMYGRVMTEPDGRTCPYCKERAQMTYIEHSARMVDQRTLRVEAAFQCYVCNRFVIGGIENAGFTPRGDGTYLPVMLHEHSTIYEIENALLGNVQYWEPVSPVGKNYPDVLAEIASPAGEAHECFSIGAFRAAVLMARSVLEATAKNQGMDGKHLYAKIEAMGTAQLVRPLMVEAAHEIRFIGNEMAHGDFATAEVTKDDALDVLELMDDILNEVFAIAARVERRRARRS